MLSKRKMELTPLNARVIIVDGSGPTGGPGQDGLQLASRRSLHVQLPSHFVG